MKKLVAYFALLCLVALPSFTFNKALTQVNAGAQERGARKETAADRRFKNFDKARKLLFAKNVPFDPNVLLTPCWRKMLKPMLDQMAEFQTIKRGGDRLKGVEMAHTLYLPEKVKLEGDTVIIVRNLVMDGREAIIRGPYSIYVFPVDQVGLLGTTFAEARRQSQGPLVKANHSSAISHPLPLIKDGKITINVSGLGRNTRKQAAGTKSDGEFKFVKASFVDTINENGAFGTDGTGGSNGNQGTQGSTGSTGGNGSCGSSSSVTGSAGSAGSVGASGQAGGAAGHGTNGGNGGTIDYSIPDSPSGSYTFLSNGGDGGDGGVGGAGGKGGTGGTGGTGGQGANCACNEGGSGWGGPGGAGGDGGSGGSGGAGGNGGTGGNGGNVSISYPLGFYNFSVFNSGGAGGAGAWGGAGGDGGNAGSGGNGGLSGGASQCNASFSGNTGSSGSSGGSGSAGSTGQGGNAGNTGSYSGTERSGGGEGGGCSQPICDPPDNVDMEQCCCVDPYGHCTSSPVLIDVLGNGFRLTNTAGGVNYDLNGDGIKETLSWTAANTDDAWLVLDINGNGTIDYGSEMFGNFTVQGTPPPGIARNGFLALSQYDLAENGGNDDGWVDSKDAIFSSLRLWQDINHNGYSEPGELHTLSELKVAGFDLDFKEAKKVDENGNRFRYRAKVKDSQGSNMGRWAWDVFLVRAQ